MGDDVHRSDLERSRPTDLNGCEAAVRVSRGSAEVKTDSLLHEYNTTLFNTSFKVFSVIENYDDKRETSLLQHLCPATQINVMENLLIFTEPPVATLAKLKMP